MTASRPEGAKELRQRVQALQATACPHARPEYFGVTLTDGCCIVALIVEYTREQVEAAQEEIKRLEDELKPDRRYYWRDLSMGLEAERDDLRAQLQTLRGEHERLLEIADQRHYVCAAHIPLGEPDNHDDECPCCEAMHQAEEKMAVAHEYGLLEARERALREALTDFVDIAQALRKSAVSGDAKVSRYSETREVVAIIDKALSKHATALAPRPRQ